MKKLIISWTYTRWTNRLMVTDVRSHELHDGKHNEDQRTGGLGHDKPWGTRYIDRQGRFFGLRPEQDEIHLYLEGGLDFNFKYRNTLNFCLEQHTALLHEIKSLIHTYPDIEVISGDLRNFDLNLWLTQSGIKSQN